MNVRCEKSLQWVCVCGGGCACTISGRTSIKTFRGQRGRGQDPQKVIKCFDNFVQGNAHFFLVFTQSFGENWGKGARPFLLGVPPALAWCSGTTVCDLHKQNMETFFKKLDKIFDFPMSGWKTVENEGPFIYTNNCLLHQNDQFKIYWKPQDILNTSLQSTARKSCYITTSMAKWLSFIHFWLGRKQLVHMLSLTNHNLRA